MRIVGWDRVLQFTLCSHSFSWVKTKSRQSQEENYLNIEYKGCRHTTNKLIKSSKTKHFLHCFTETLPSIRNNLWKFIKYIFFALFDQIDEGSLYLSVGKAVEVEVAAVVDVEEDVADGSDDSEGVISWPDSISQPVEAGDDIDDSLGCGEHSEAQQCWHQQQTKIEKTLKATALILDL